jgi:hypothetical protein
MTSKPIALILALVLAAPFAAEACSGRCANAGHMLMIPSAEFSAGQGLGAERERPAEATFR